MSGTTTATVSAHSHLDGRVSDCNDRSVSRLRISVKTSAAYLLFYNSLQNVLVILLLPMVLLLWCEAWGGWGTAWCLWMGRDGGLMPDLWWGWWFSGRRMWVVECFGPFPILPVPLLSLYSPYPLDQLSLILPVPLHALYFPQ